MIFDILEMGKKASHFRSPNIWEEIGEEKFNKVALEGRVRKKMCYLFLLLINNHNKILFASSNMYIIYGIYFIPITEGYKNKIWLGVNKSDEY